MPLDKVPPTGINLDYIREHEEKQHFQDEDYDPEAKENYEANEADMWYDDKDIED